jgi:ATP-dependent Clp protease protease subunit
MQSSGCGMAIRGARTDIPAMESPTPPPQPRDPLLPLAARAAERLFTARTVLLFGEIDTALADRVCTELLALAADGDAPIKMIVHSPGGHVEAGDSIHDVVRFIRPDVHMIGSGWVASAGALVFVAAKPEHRVALPNTRFLLHQPLGGAKGHATDIEIEVRQIVAMRERLNRIFARETSHTLEQIVADTERNFWMTANEAKDYGLVSRIVERWADVA